MEGIQVSAFVLGIAFASSFVSTFRFYRGRVAKATAEQKAALIPTVIISLSFLVGAVFSFVSFLALQDLASLLPNSGWVIAAELIAPLFGFTLLVAVVVALKETRLYLLPIGLLIISYVMSLLSPTHPLDDPYLSIWITVGSLMMLFPMILFAYLWKSTRRPTTFGMFVGILLYLVYYVVYEYTLSEYVGYLGYYLNPAEFPMHVQRYLAISGFMVVFLFLPVMGLSFIYWFFRYSERRIGWEIIGYALTFPIIATEFAIVLQFMGVLPIEYLIMLLVTATAAGMFLITGSYLYGRYKESPRRQTLMLAAFSFTAGLGYLIYNIGEHIHWFYIGPMPWIDLISIPTGMITGGFLFLSAIYALEWKSLVLVPPAVIIPFMILAIMFGPVLPSWLFFSMIAAAIALTVLPGAMFGTLWWKMNKSKEKGTGRVLGIFLGFIMILLASPFQFVPMAPSSDPIRIMGSVVLLIGSIIFLLGVSGRLDKWFYLRGTQ
nr:hypothetical protein [Candidatus Njordarchaeota archaeon]